MAETDPKTVQDLTAVVQTLLQQMQDKFQTMSDQIIGRIDDMSCRIDDLEKNIADLMTQAGVEELEGENKAASTKTNQVRVCNDAMAAGQNGEDCELGLKAKHRG
ncbi:heat shock factor-binding protein 1 [Sceloporus undulatus]|uniref:heat shock factor-binding protein 1 n=1 Tax=Sceloporus undulatus TaxID=8520 RepID=UPI001C4CAABA|nr:heat shock factor-binding protein 1 [Sceloporus undulatus]